MKRIICLFKGHVWGETISIKRTFAFWDQHTCLRCDKTEEVEMGDWNSMCVQYDETRMG